MGHRWSDVLKSHIAETASLQNLVAMQCGPSMELAIQAIAASLRRGGKLMTCGNGASAADCQRIAIELTGRVTKEFKRPGIASVALTTDTSFLTAYANDSGFEGVFERQVEALGKRGDVLLGISTSGESANVRRAFHLARKMGITTIALVGEGGPLSSKADFAIIIPSSLTSHIQEAMLPIEHVICHAVEREMFPD